MFLDVPVEIDEIANLGIAGKSEEKLEVIMQALGVEPALDAPDDVKKLVAAGRDVVLAAIEFRSASRRFHLLNCKECRERGGHK
jgi:hypothetical protein